MSGNNKIPVKMEDYEITLQSRLLTDYRLTAGEVTVQEQEVTSISLEYSKVIQEFVALPEDVKKEYTIEGLTEPNQARYTQETETGG